MMTEQPFLPLFFNPEDEKLWEQLQKLPPEKRAETVKQALYEFFQIHFDVQSDNVNGLRLNSETGSSGEESNSVDSEELASEDEEDEAEDPLSQIVTENELSLESLFEASPQEIKPDPLKNLISVIGEEDDEEVLKLLFSGQKCNTEDKIETELKEPVLSTEKNEVSLRKETIVPSGGLAFLLQNVIGEEEDEEVLHFFQNITHKTRD